MGGVTSIPWTAIVSYAQYYRLGDHHTDILLRVIRAMDNSYVTARALKEQKDEDTNK